MDAPAFQVADNRIGVVISLRKQKSFGFLLWSRCGNCLGERFPLNGFHGLQKGTALDFYEIVKGCLAANLSGKPVPFPVADFERIVFFGAVGIAGYLYQLVRFIDLKVCQQIQLLGLLNVLRSEVGHRLSLLPVGLGFCCLNDRIRTIFHSRPEFLHVGTFTLLPGLENIT